MRSWYLMILLLQKETKKKGTWYRGLQVLVSYNWPTESVFSFFVWNENRHALRHVVLAECSWSITRHPRAMSRVRRPPPTAAHCQTERILLSFSLLAASPGLTFVLSSTFPRGHRPWTVRCAHVERYSPDEWKRFSLYSPSMILPMERRVRDGGTELFCKFTEHQIEVTFPKRSRFSGDCKFYPTLCTSVHRR